MSDDLVKRLLDIAGDTNEENEIIYKAADRIENLTNALEGIKQWSSYSGSTQHIHEMACNALNPDFVPPTIEERKVNE